MGLILETKNGNTLQGGLSNEVATSFHFKKYTQKPELTGGYIGDSNRTAKRDQIIENYLREEQELGPEGISEWLSSTCARHMMSDVDEKMTLKEFKNHVTKYANDAFIQVTLWAHPDHTGFLVSSQKLREALKKHLK